jgi:hypothetical protein
MLQIFILWIESAQLMFVYSSYPKFLAWHAVLHHFKALAGNGEFVPGARFS